MARPHLSASSQSESTPPGRSGGGRRRALVASIVGSVILAGLAMPLLPGIVVARGPINDSPYATMTSPGASSNAYAPPTEQAVNAPRSERRSWGGGQPVCVRLCDGAFFPVSTGEEATCAALCPDAPTALYREQAGSDKIEDAVSQSGAPYTALPVALRYRTTLDNTCTCHRSGAQQYPVAQDPTLRKGDYVMTPNGIVMFAGAKNAPHAPSEFTALAAAAVPQAQRATLTEIERASQTSRDGAGRKAAAAAPGRQPPLLNVSALHSQPGAVATTN